MTAAEGQLVNKEESINPATFGHYARLPSNTNSATTDERGPGH